jgi:hypothetical protein
VSFMAIDLAPRVRSIATTTAPVVHVRRGVGSTLVAVCTEAMPVITCAPGTIVDKSGKVANVIFRGSFPLRLRSPLEKLVGVHFLYAFPVTRLARYSGSVAYR